jgi:hypothetical protein
MPDMATVAAHSIKTMITKPNKVLTRKMDPVKNPAKKCMAIRTDKAPGLGSNCDQDSLNRSRLIEI